MPQAPTTPADRGYPPHREADVLLSDGGTVHLRPITPADGPAVVAVHGRFSDRTRYLRYFSPYPRIPQRDLTRFTTVDHADREAIVVVLGDQIVAIGRYDRIGPDEAEVAFVVEDAHQGRGIGSVLLEHLAAAAAEHGIRRFVAEILPENGAMMRIFTDAGYVPSRTYDDGVVHLQFDIEPTEASIEVSRRREQRSEGRSIARLLHPASVAVIGAGSQPGGIGRTVLDNIRRAGFTGVVHAVNTRHGEIDGLPAYDTVLDIEGRVDLAVVAVPAADVPTVVTQCAAKGVQGLVVVSSGFGETGPAGREAEQRLVETARANGMRVIGPNCLGILNTDDEVRLNATLAPALPERGRVGFFSQSGALGVAVLEQARDRSLGLSSFVSAGNRADVSGNDLMQYWMDDPATDVVLLYLETFGNPRKFARVARALGRRKPVVAVKSASAPPGLDGTAPALSQGGSEALFAQSGVIRVDTLSQLFDVAQILAYQPLPAGHRVAIVGNSSALGVLAADAAAAAGLDVVPGCTRDIGPEGGPEEFAAAVRDAVNDPRVDALVAVFIPALATPGTAFADVLLAGAAESGKPVVSTFLGTDGVPERLRRVTADGVTGLGSVPSFVSPEAAVQALGRVAAYAEWRRRPAGQLPALEVDTEGARRLVGGALAAHPSGGPLPDTAVAALLTAYGIDVVPSRRCADADEAVAAADALGYPVTLKAADGYLRHRVDLGGVRLDLTGPDEVRAAYTGIVGLTPDGPHEVLVQPMCPPGVACLVEVVEDPSFGAVVGFGLSGVATELLGDVAWRAAPLTDADAHALVRAPLAAPMLFGHRGATPVDTAALADLLLRLGRLADEIPEVRSVELRPVLVGGAGLAVLHADVVVGPAGDRHDAGPRRLRAAGPAPWAAARS
ncbi:MAG TPA: GNAT family N-acetyltransferase [Mycobacteriales bacterium]|nr:GNAT family N-acetyltransferase [Mycobacteriales bacterium]